MTTSTMEGISGNAEMMDLYSRQIGAYGLELMGKLVQLRVLIVGATGAGVECAKNLILAGPKAVTIHDDGLVEACHLGTNFYLHSDDIGKNRAQACIGQLSTLNPYVVVDTHSGVLDASVWAEYHVIVYTDASPLSHLKLADAFCHANGKAFIYASNLGVTSTIFSDFGSSHVITDADGEPCRMNVVTGISETGIVTVSADRHGMDDGDHVHFEEVEGMIEINHLKDPLPIKRVYRKDGKGSSILVANKFQIDTDIVSGFSQYTTGGVVSQVKVPTQVSYKTLSDAITHPLGPNDWAFPHMDMNKMLMANQGAQLHFAKLGIWEFQERHGGDLPRLHCMIEAKECVEYAIAANEAHKSIPQAITVDEIDVSVVQNAALFARAEICGFSAFLGGVIAQEAVKVPGKFTPLNQWQHHDALELVPNGVPEDSISRGSRYDWQINIFGNAFQEKLFKQKWFLVGAGALGCEYIKGIALMGLGAKGGQIYLTDMDRIELSNLNRQFLFRRDNVGHPKSVSAAQAARKMNPDLNVHTYEIPVGPDTEDLFDSAFWSNLDGVWNALDNVKARRYTDSKCVFFEKPLLESGTLGTKANSEIIIPHSTTCYSDHKEVEQDTIPMCTLRNFPHFIEHCIEWGRAHFSTMFEDSAQELNSLINDREKYFEQVEKEGNASAQLEKLENVRRIYDIVSSGVTFDTCTKLALDAFVQQFRDRILDLTHAFPEQSRKTDKDSGADLGLFWSGEKRFPQGASFDPENELHLAYVLNTSNLFAAMFGLPEQRSLEVVRDSVISWLPSVPDWSPNDAIKIDMGDDNTDDAKDDSEGDEDLSKVEALKNFFTSEDLSSIPNLCVADFEKDDDSNFHIDFIAAASNLRAWNYRIKLASRHQVKMIAGKIIPALATTTAMITGLVEIELYKLVMDLPADKFSCANVNLAVNSFQSFEPLPPNKSKAEIDPIMFSEVKPVPDGFTVWDKVVVRGSGLTVSGFCDALAETHFGTKVSMLFKHGISQDDIDAGKAKPLYNSNPYLPPAMKAQQQKAAASCLKKLYEELYGPLPKSQPFLILDGDFQDPKGNDVKIPVIVYHFV